MSFTRIQRRRSIRQLRTESIFSVVFEDRCFVDQVLSRPCTSRSANPSWLPHSSNWFMILCNSYSLSFWTICWTFWMIKRLTSYFVAIRTDIFSIHSLWVLDLLLPCLSPLSFRVIVFVTTSSCVSERAWEWEVQLWPWSTTRPWKSALPPNQSITIPFSFIVD